jgi:NADH-ubiquinone oxidoreductase chain 6
MPYINYLYLFIDKISNQSTASLINILSLICIISGVFVITTKNPIVSVLFLIALFLNVGCILMIIGLTFIGLSYLLIYVGAVSILFIFILMLINIRISELISNTKNSIPLITIIFILLNFLMINVLPNNNVLISEQLNHNYLYTAVYEILQENFYYSFFSDTVNISSYNLWDENILDLNPVSVIGNTMYTVYPMMLIVTSLILLLAMIGVVAITINYNKK